MTKLLIEPIGYIQHDAHSVPKHYNESELEGKIVVDKKYVGGLTDIKAGECITVIFHFHKSSKFTKECLRRIPPHGSYKKGVFSICSPVRPNPIGMSILKVRDVVENIIYVKHIDMLNGTPVLDIKPYIRCALDC